jgi:hypothetical protein
MSEPRASLTRSHFAGSASLLPRLAFRRTPWLHPRYGHHVPASAHARLYVVDLLGHLSWRMAPACTARVPLTPPVRAAKSCAYTRACSAPRCPRAPFATCCAHSSTCRARQSRAPTLLLRPPNTCTRHQLPHARSLLPPEPAPPGLARRAALRQRPQPEPPATCSALRRAIARAPAPAHAPLARAPHLRFAPPAPTCAPPVRRSPSVRRSPPPGPACTARRPWARPLGSRHPPLRRAAAVRAPGSRHSAPSVRRTPAPCHRSSRSSRLSRRSGPTCTGTRCSGACPAPRKPAAAPAVARPDAWRCRSPAAVPPRRPACCVRK